MAGLRLSEATVQRTTEDVGARLAALLAAGVTFGPAVAWDWQCDAQGRTLAYATVGFSVHKENEREEELLDQAREVHHAAAMLRPGLARHR